MEPLIKEENKRKISCLLPYRLKEGGYEFFLQMRTKDAKVNPGLFGLFGGGIENEETIEEGLLRETMEELVYKPTGYRYFCKYEIATAVMHVFIEEVSDDFESKVDVQEGQYGTFMSLNAIESSATMSHVARIICMQLNSFLSDTSLWQRSQ